MTKAFFSSTKVLLEHTSMNTSKDKNKILQHFYNTKK